MPSRLILIAIALGVAVMVLIASIVIFVSIQSIGIVKNLNTYNANILTGPIIAQAAIINRTPIGFSGDGVLASYNATSVIEYALVNYSSINASEVKSRLSVYDSINPNFNSDPVKKIYFVRLIEGENGWSTAFPAACYNCFDEFGLYDNLSKYLGQYGLIYNSSSFTYTNVSGQGVNYNNLADIPHNSVVILASGLLPQDLFPKPNSTTISLLTLLNRGDTVVYVGLNLSLGEPPDGGAPIDYRPDNASTNMLLLAGLNTTKWSTYIANSASGFYFESPTFRFFRGNGPFVYGPITYTQVYNGTMIAFGNDPKDGWKNSSDLAHDIAAALSTHFWLNVIEQSPENTTYNPSGTLTFFATNAVAGEEGIPYYLASELNYSYSMINLTFYNQNGFIVRQVPFRLNFEDNGTLNMPGVVGIGQPFTMVASSNIRNGKAIFYLINMSNSLLESYIYSTPSGPFPILNGSKVDEDVEPSLSYYDSRLKPGYYIAELFGYRENSSGSFYIPIENALFYIPFFNVTVSRYNFNNGTFIFNISNNNQPMQYTTYSVSLNGAYQQHGTVNLSYIYYSLLNYTLPKGTLLKFGSQTLHLNLNGINYSFNLYYSPPPSHAIPPLYIEFAIAAVAILLLNLIVKTPTRDDYFIDVPRFPPTEKVEVKTSADSILNIFDNMNNRFKWKYMPLTAEELKAGISNTIRHNNIPIMVTMENTEEILDGLANRGYVETIAPYFMPKRWKEASHHDIEYLVVFRKLRDFAIKNALLFTDLDSSKNVDMVIANRGVHSNIYIYSSASGVMQIKFMPNIKTFLVFIDSETRTEFMEKLYNTYGSSAEKLRMSIASGQIITIDTENLDRLLY